MESFVNARKHLCAAKKHSHKFSRYFRPAGHFAGQCFEETKSALSIFCFHSVVALFFQVLPHLYWPWMFYSFGVLGFIWVIFWVVLYKEVRGPVEEEFIQPPKVSAVCAEMLRITGNCPAPFLGWNSQFTEHSCVAGQQSQCALGRVLEPLVS